MAEAPDPTLQRQRSPSFPAVELAEAVRRVKDFYGKEGKLAVPQEVAVKHWGYSDKSSGGRAMLAALRAYGLIRSEGTKIGLSERALDIVVEGSPRRDVALKAAALEPPLFKQLWEERGTNLGSEEGLRFELVRHRGFNDKSAGDFIRSYKAAIGLAALTEQAKIPDKAVDARGGRTLPPSGGLNERAAVGDLVQWQSQGVDQFVEPKRVRALAADGEWVFVEGSETGVPAGQVAIIERAKEPTMEPPILPLSHNPKVHPPGADALSLNVPFRGKTLTVMVTAQGEPLRREHIEKVLRFLELAKDDLEREEVKEPAD